MEWERRVTQTRWISEVAGSVSLTCWCRKGNTPTAPDSLDDLGHSFDHWNDGKRRLKHAYVATYPGLAFQWAYSIHRNE